MLWRGLPLKISELFHLIPFEAPESTTVQKKSTSSPQMESKLNKNPQKKSHVLLVTSDKNFSHVLPISLP